MGAGSKEERAILKRARGSNSSWPSNDQQDTCVSPSPPDTTEPIYPEADVHTLALLGSIDALLKAPPPPPRWALLKALAVLEEAADKRKAPQKGERAT